MNDLVARTQAIAAAARANDPRREVMRRCPELTEWCRQLNAAMDRWRQEPGDKVTLLRAGDAEGVFYERP